jgi:DnaK suppressor protein
MPGKKTAAKPAKAKKPAPAAVATRKAAPPTSAKKAAPAAPPAKSKPVSAPATPARKPAAAPASAPVAAAPASTPRPASKSAPAPQPQAPTVPPRRTAPDVPMATYVQRGTAALAAPQVDGDDGEESSLLAGPRNVSPYIAKRGEQYMNKEQLEHFRQILMNWKRDLMEEVDRTVSHMKDEAANFPDPNDRATQEEEFSLELRTRDRERKLIRKIEEALKRIEDGSYGYCLETGEEIGIKRLEARPVATLSIEAQERRERREKQYGDRDDRYR